MRKRIAVLITGAIRGSIDILINIKNIKEQFGNSNYADIYFHTWDLPFILKIMILSIITF